jgi:processive 1,2-diacylglycerol beta-glucosyltransferase
MAIPRVLILTASFGDGHNSAARGLAGAFTRMAGGSVKAQVLDLIRDAEPLTSDALARLYGFAITHLPWGWQQFYRIAAHLPLNRDPLHVLGRISLALAREIQARPPAAVVATFPLYAHLLQNLLGRPPFPVFTAVTDSITIHPVWLSEATSTYFAPDQTSAAHLRRLANSEAAVINSGFPVSPVFSELPAAAPGERLRRVLFFPATSRRVVRRAMASLLTDGPHDLELTVVLGRHVNRLRSLLDECRTDFPHRRVDVLGWTNEVPRLMFAHDLVIAKAGGATTHECCAAGRPLIVTKIVPGQEEGNAELVQRRRSGVHEEDPQALGPLVRDLAETDRWSRLRDAAWRHRRPDGARLIARHVLAQLGHPVAAGSAVPVPSTP